METPILVTGAAGRVGAVGRTITKLLLQRGKAVRAMVRSDDDRAQALRDLGAEIVVGDLLDLDSMHRAIDGCETLRTITFQDIPVEPWRDALLKRGFPVHVVNHLATLANLHRSGRFDRMSDEVLMLTGHRPLSVQDFVRKNAAAFSAPAKHNLVNALEGRIWQI